MSEAASSSPTLVRDLMSIGVLTCSEDTSIVELARVLLDQGKEEAVVLDDLGHAVGVIGRDDLIRAYGAGEYKEMLAEEVMRDDVPQIPPDIPLTAAAQIMQDKGVRILYLTHHAGGIEYPAAMLSYKNMLRHIAMVSEEDLSDLGIVADRELPMESFAKRRASARERAGLSRPCRTEPDKPVRTG
jgi:CBS domain-containing protein